MTLKSVDAKSSVDLRNTYRKVFCKCPHITAVIFKAEHTLEEPEREIAQQPSRFSCFMYVSDALLPVDELTYQKYCTIQGEKGGGKKKALRRYMWCKLETMQHVARELWRVG